MVLTTHIWLKNLRRKSKLLTMQQSWTPRRSLKPWVGGGKCRLGMKNCLGCSRQGSRIIRTSKDSLTSQLTPSLILKTCKSLFVIQVSNKKPSKIEKWTWMDWWVRCVVTTGLLNTMNQTCPWLQLWEEEVTTVLKTIYHWWTPTPLLSLLVSSKSKG